MSLATTHKEYILEQLMLEYLRDGEIPTADQLEADLATYQETHPNLEEPTSRQVDFSVEHGNNSSASLMQTIAETTDQDIGIVTREIYRLGEVGSRFNDRWSTEMKRLEANARKLEHRIDSLLLLNSDTAGFFAHVGDVFADMNQVDTDNTTARINLHETTVTINPSLSTQSGRGSMINLTERTENDITFTPLSKRAGIAYHPVNNDNALRKIFTTDNSTWVGKVVCDTSGEMICELKAKLADEDLEVSKIAFEFTGPLTTTRSTVTCQYSDNGYTWNLVPSAEATKTLARNMAWFFPLTTMRWVKFIFRKPAPDNTSNEYIFSASHIRFFGNTYEITEGGTLVTQALQALNTEDDAVKFSLVSLDACQELPDNAGINFSISASKDNSTWTSWMRISPSDTEDILYPKTINLGGSDWKDNLIEGDTSLLDDNVTTGDNEQMNITRTFDSSSLGLLGYRFKNAKYGVVNTAIALSEDVDPDPTSNSVVVWRNARYKDIDSYPDTLTVRGVPRGWGLDGSTYSCYFEVINSDGIILDFGDKACVLDGAEISGTITVPAGVHKFATDAANWIDITDNIPSAGAKTEEELKTADPLYPYNHKLIIEGFPYPIGSGFDGTRIYRGTDISAEFYANKTSLFDLENNNRGYGYFATRGVGESTSPTLAVVVEFDSTNSDYTNELFVVKWRSGATDASMYEYIKLKAELWTQDSGVTPVLTSYRIRLGM